MNSIMYSDLFSGDNGVEPFAAKAFLNLPMNSTLPLALSGLWNSLAL